MIFVCPQVLFKHMQTKELKTRLFPIRCTMLVGKSNIKKGGQDRDLAHGLLEGSTKGCQSLGSPCMAAETQNASDTCIQALLQVAMEVVIPLLKVVPTGLTWFNMWLMVAFMASLVIPWSLPSMSASTATPCSTGQQTCCACACERLK